ncbi:MAG: HAMP domain-containing protein [Candidatus Aminicenantes bacterium]|nr:HAMP domain-containing protein [Candidatus Aminicenantes bacterium]
MNKSLFLKTFFSYLLIMALVLLLVFLFASGIIENQYRENVQRGLGQLAASLQRNFVPLLAARDTAALDVLVKELGKETDARLTVIATDGRVLADSEGDPRHMENHADRPEFVLAMQGKPAEFSRLSSTLHRAMLYRAVPIRRDGRVIGVLRLSLFVSAIEQMLVPARRKINILLAVLSAIALVLAFLYARYLTAPIKRLTQAAHQVAGGDFSPRVRIDRRDELRQLADAFNHMVEQQGALLESVQRQQLELETILASIGEGLLVLDRDGKIILANQSFKKMCLQPECPGRPYWEMLRDSRLNELIKRSLETRQDSRGELDINDGVYLVHVSPLPGEGPLIVTFSDISEYKRLERIKRDFVSNLSHELRTPLTAIKGFVETLAEESSAQNRNYLDIINRHTDRLVNMINDLLTLSEMEEPRMRLEKKRIDLLKLVDNVAIIFAGRCREKNIHMEVDAGANLPAFFGDPFRLEQLFINLVDNAIKYTEHGEIRVSLAKREGEIEIRVRDSGPGIATEHLPRIFERFYVVDRSRSRQQGGTGLGLAIAKHIVLLHDGRIEAVSQPGQGTEFIITLPLVPEA